MSFEAAFLFSGQLFGDVAFWSSYSGLIPLAAAHVMESATQDRAEHAAHAFVCGAHGARAYSLLAAHSV